MAKQPAEQLFWQIVNQRQASVGLDGEAAIGHGQETARGDTAHFRDEPALLCPRTNMLKHRIAMDYVKLVVVKGSGSPATIRT